MNGDNAIAIMNSIHGKVTIAMCSKGNEGMEAIELNPRQARELIRMIEKSIETVEREYV
jgi:hypothetical protein